MNLYHIKRTDEFDYDTYDAAVVAASSEDEARLIHPRSLHLTWNPTTERWEDPNDLDDNDREWIHPMQVVVSLIGVAKRNKQAIIVASFNAG